MPIPGLPQVQSTSRATGGFLTAGLATPRVLLSAPLPMGGAVRSAWDDVRRAAERALAAALRQLDWPTATRTSRRLESTVQDDRGESTATGTAVESPQTGRAEGDDQVPSSPPHAVSWGMVFSAAQSWAESALQLWNLDIMLFVLLACTFQYANLLSMLLLSILILGMHQDRTSVGPFWRGIALPILGGLVVEQYLVLSGVSDWVLGHAGGKGIRLKPDVKVRKNTLHCQRTRMRFASLFF